MKKILISMLAATGVATSAFAAAPSCDVGIVDFATCVMDSKYGKQEQESLEAIKNQMATLIEDAQKKLEEVANKLQDSDYMDGLSADGEEELRGQYAALNDEYMRYQQQYYQMLQQAQSRMMQAVLGHINVASEDVAKSEHLKMVLNKEICFFYGPKLDVTQSVVTQMDKNFDKNTKKAVESSKE